MTYYELHDPLIRTREHMKYLKPKERAEMLWGAAMETGTIIEPEPNNTRSSGSFEITAHGVWAQGSDLAETTANWMKAAERETHARRALISAEHILHHPDEYSDTDLRKACDLILEGSKERTLRKVAKDFLTQITKAA